MISPQGLIIISEVILIVWWRMYTLCMMDYSEATAQMIDQEIKEIIDEQYQRAKEILMGKKEPLGKGAKLLLEREKLEGEEIKALLADA